MKSVFALVISLTALCNSLAGKPIDLQLRLQAGEVFFLETRTSDVIEKTGALKGWEARKNVIYPDRKFDKIRYRFEVLEVLPGCGYRLKMEMDQRLDQMQLAGFSRHVDSEYPDPAQYNGLQRAIDQFNARQHEIIVDFQGCIQEESNPVQTWDGHVSPQGYEVTKKNQTSFHVDRIAPWLAIFPSEPVEVHTRWKNEAFGASYRLLRADDESATIVRSDGFKITIDRKSGWIRHATHREVLSTMQAKGITRRILSLRGYRQDRRRSVVISGYVEGNASGSLRLVINPVPGRINSSEWLELREDDAFFWSHPVKEPFYFFIKRKSDICVSGYARPGDELHITLPAQPGEPPAIIRGRGAEQCRYLQEFSGRFPHYHPDDHQHIDWLRSHSLSSFKASQENKLKAKLHFLEAHRKSLDPLFYEKEYWRIHYDFAATMCFFFPRKNNMNIYQNKVVPGETKTFMGFLDTLPVLNERARGIPTYTLFLKWYLRYLALELSQMKGVVGSRIPLMRPQDRFCLSRAFLTGYPMYHLQAEQLSEALYEEQTDLYELQPMLRQFEATCPDSNMVTALKKQIRAFERLAPGQPAPLLTGKRSVLGNAGSGLFSFLNTGYGFKGRPVVLHLWKHKDHDPWFSQLDFKALRQQSPEITFVHLNVHPDLKPKEWKAMIGEEEGFHFFAGERAKETSDVYQISDHLYGPRLYFLDRKGKIKDFVVFSNSLNETNEKIHDQLEALMQGEPSWLQREWRRILPLILATLTITGLILLLIMRWRTRNIRRREARRRHEVEMEIRAIRSQLNPHFLFNTMSSIQNLITGGKSDLASEYLAELAALMRSVLRHSEKGMVSLAEELDLIRRYCELEALRFNFDFAIEADNHLLNAEVPAMVMQPFIENAILHGFASLPEKGRLHLQVKEQDGQLIIRVLDNGWGFENLSGSGAGTGRGIKLIRERLQLIYGPFAAVHLSDLPEGGAQVEICLPLEEDSISVAI